MLVYWLKSSQDGRVNALYSTPSIYTDLKHAADEEWPLKTEDFFPWVLRRNADILLIHILLTLLKDYNCFPDTRIIQMHIGLVILQAGQPSKAMSDWWVDTIL